MAFGTQTAAQQRRRRAGLRAFALAALLAASGLMTTRLLAGDAEDIEIAVSLAKMLQAGRTVISSNQDLINDPGRGDKGLTGDVVLKQAVENYTKATGLDPRSDPPASRRGRLLQAEMESIKAVVDENQKFINEKGVAFKGFIPAVFARLVTERLTEKVGVDLKIKVTAPPELVRNRKSRPDEWEKSIIQTKFMTPSWKTGQMFYQTEPYDGRDALRVMVPEYYTPSCLSCHGEKKGEVDITGYPKEGASEGDLGGVISIVLFRHQE